MSWELWLSLIVKYGIPGAHEIWKIVTTNPSPTPADWDKLLEVNRKSLDQIVHEASTRLGVIPPPPPSP